MEQFGQYTLIRRIAYGGMGELFLAQRPGIAGFSKQVVVKRIRPDLAHDPQFVEMFLNEGRVAALLDHPNVVHIYELGEVEGHYFLSMEYVPGKNLAAVLERLKGPLELPLALHVLIQVCEGLAFAHQATGTDGRSLNLVHRDVSPPNVLLSYSGSVKITDFGIAKVDSAAKQTAAGVLKGKFAYLSPEQARGESIDKRSDIFSLGLVLFEATTGTRAVPGNTDTEILYSVAKGELRRPTSHLSDYPAHLERIFLKATAKKPAERYQDVKALQEDLIGFQVSQHKMLMTASRVASFMQRLFREDARAEGETSMLSGPKKSVTTGEAPTDDGLAMLPTVAPGSSSSGPVKVIDRSGQRTLRRGRGPSTLDPGQAQRPLTGPTRESVPPGAGREWSDPEASTAVEVDQPPGDDVAFQSRIVASIEELLESSSLEEVDQDALRRALDRSADSTPGARPLTPARPQKTGLGRATGPASAQGRGGRMPLIALTTVSTLIVGFAALVVFAPAGAPAWIRDMRAFFGFANPIETPDRPRQEADMGAVVEAPARRLDARPLARVGEGDAQLGTNEEDPRIDDARVTGEGRLVVRSSPPMSVWIGGRLIGETPVAVALPRGPHLVRLTNADEGITKVRKVLIRRSETTVLRVSVGTGRLVVKVRPWAHVEIDGSRKGTTPMAPIRLPEGTYTVELINDAIGQSVTKQVTIEPGRTATIVHRF